MFHVLIPALVLVALAVTGFAISLLFKRFDFYKHGSIEHNPHMKERGISCVKNDEINCTTSGTGCEACSCSLNP